MDLRQDMGEHGTVVALSAGDHHRQWSAPPVDGLVDLGGQPAARAAAPLSAQILREGFAPVTYRNPGPGGL